MHLVNKIIFLLLYNNYYKIFIAPILFPYTFLQIVLGNMFLMSLIIFVSFMISLSLFRKLNDQYNRTSGLISSSVACFYVSVSDPLRMRS